MSKPASPAGTFYSREIQKPKNRREGFANFVQLIINNIEAGDTQQALIGAVDLLDCITSNANPYASVTDDPHTVAITRARAEGVAEGKQLALTAVAATVADMLEAAR
jgi:hypothetical protein